MESTIFMNNITCLDYALVNSHGFIQGSSYLVSVYLTGEVTEEESVVLDFSKAKKTVKSLIDGPEGLDHKLVINKNYDVKIESVDCHSLAISSKHFSLVCPSDSIQLIETNIYDYIVQLIENHYKNENIKCKIILDRFTNSVQDTAIYFTYSHGLKKSSAYGCQNIGHGHRSFVEVYDSEGDFDNDMTENIASEFDNKIIINRENIIEAKENEITIGYECSRGFYEITYKKPHEWLILDTETTIEYMGEYIKQNFDLTNRMVSISEGLSKGIILHGK
jgi:6-pyruvoyl-tetrahydropterin synthase